MARRVTRPVALVFTCVFARLGFSANAATMLAWAVGLAAAATLGVGTPVSMLVGAGLLQLWYLLDHIDGQLARLRRKASLDGAALDFLMHHTLNIAVPVGLGVGCWMAGGEPWLMLVAVVAGLAMLVTTLVHDTRHKAMIGRLKRVHGKLDAVGGAGGRPSPQPPWPNSPIRLLARLIRKLGEMHVVMNLLTLLAIVAWLVGDTEARIFRVYLFVLAGATLLTAAWSVRTGLADRTAETEFAAWFTPPEGTKLVFRQGWWYVEEKEEL